MKKKVLAILLSAALLVSVSPLAVMASYSDMPTSDHWSYQALSTASELGLLQGSNGKILPNDNLTRAQMATILVRAFGATEQAADFNFSDVKPSDWFYANMSIAVKMGWFQGGGGNTLRPNDPISRQEVFVVLARAIGAAADESFVLADNFTDASDIAAWAADAAAAMAGKGYIKGANGKMNPNNRITRAEFAQLMYNLIQGGEITVEAPKPETPETQTPEKEEQGSNEFGSASGESSGGSGNGSGGGSGTGSGGSSSGDDNDVSDPWGDVVVPDSGEGETDEDLPSMEDLTTSDEGWTGIY